MMFLWSFMNINYCLFMDIIHLISLEIIKIFASVCLNLPIVQYLSHDLDKLTRLLHTHNNGRGARLNTLMMCSDRKQSVNVTDELFVVNQHAQHKQPTY